MDQFIIGSYADPPIPRPYMDSHFVQWTANTRWATIEHMRIAHRRFDIAVAQKLLDGSNVRPVFEQMRGKRSRLQDREVMGFTRLSCLSCQSVPNTKN